MSVKLSEVPVSDLLCEISALNYHHKNPGTLPFPERPSSVYKRKNIRIRGILDLRSIDADFGIEFQNCIFDKPILLAYSKFKFVRLYDCDIAAVDGIGLEVRDDLAIATTPDSFAQRSCCRATVRLTNAVIGRRLILNGTEFNEGDSGTVSREFLNVSDVQPRGAFDAGHIKVGSTLWMASVERSGASYGVRSRGLMSFRGAEILGKIYCESAVFIAGRHKSHCDGRYSSVIEAHSVEKKEIRSGFIRSYRLLDYLFGIQNRNSLISEDEIIGRFNDVKNQNFPQKGRNYLLSVLSFDMYRAQVKGGVSFYRCAFEGTARFGGAEFGYKFSLQGSRFSEVSSLFLETPECEDSYRQTINAVRVFSYYGSSASMPRGALDAFRMGIGGSLYISSEIRRFETKKNAGDLYSFGRISFTDSKVGGRLVVSGACIIKTCDFVVNRTKPMASLELAGIHVARNLHLSDGFFGIGTTILSRAKIGGSLLITKAKFAVDGDQDFALLAENMIVENEVIVDHGCIFSGKTSFRSGVFKSSFIIENSMFFDRPTRRTEERDKKLENRKAVTDVREWTEVIPESETKKKQRPGLRQRKFKDYLMDNILLRLKKCLDEIPYYLISDSHLINFHGCSVGGSLRFSSWEREGRYCAIFGFVSLEGLDVGEELDLCARSMSTAITNIGSYDFRDEEVFSYQALIPEHANLLDKCSIFGFDLRYARVTVLRVGSFLPSLGCILVNGLKFKGLSGDFLKNPNVAIDFIFSASHLVGTYRPVFRYPASGEGIRFHNLSMGFREELLKKSQSIANDFGMLYSPEFHYCSRLGAEDARSIVGYCVKKSKGLNWSVRLHDQLSINFLDVYKELASPENFWRIDGFVYRFRRLEIFSYKRLSPGVLLNGAIVVLIIEMLALISPQTLWFLYKCIGYTNVPERFLFVSSILLAVFFFWYVESGDKKIWKLASRKVSAWSQIRAAGVAFRSMKLHGGVSQRFFDSLTGLGLKKRYIMSGLIIVCLLVTPVFSALFRAGLSQDNGTVSFVQSEADYVVDSPFKTLYFSFESTFSLAFPDLSGVYLDASRLYIDGELDSGCNIKEDARKFLTTADGVGGVLLSMLIFLVKASGWLAVALLLSGLKLQMRKI